jgi:hypothetical protein
MNPAGSPRWSRGLPVAAGYLFALGALLDFVLVWLEIPGAGAGDRLWLFVRTFLGDLAFLTAAFFVLACIAVVSRLGSLALAGFVVFASLARWIRFAGHYYFGQELRPEALRHARQLALFATPGILAVVGLALGATLAASLYVASGARVPRRPEERASGLRRSFWLAAYPLMILVLLRASLEGGGRERLLPLVRLPTMPAELSLARVLVELPRRTPEIPVRRLDAGERERLRDFGIRLSEQPDWPWVQEHAFSQPLPSRPGAPTGRPNVIAFFLEGLSAELVEPLSAPNEPAMPSFRAFADEGLVATNHYSASASTDAGLVAQLCSVFPVAEDRAPIASLLGRRLRLPCLPGILADRGWATAMFLDGDGIGDRRALLALGSGFRGLLDKSTLLGRWVPDAAEKRKSLTNREMFAALGRWLEGRHDDPTPFFAAVSMEDTHPPYPHHGGDLGAALADTDDAFGSFLRTFGSSPLAGRTILVVTGDHSHWSSAGFRELYGGAPDLAGFGRMALFIRDPLHDLPKRHEALSSSVDFAPTILHLLGIDQPNAFMGSSLFEPGPSRKSLFGASGELGFVLDGSRPVGMPFPVGRLRRPGARRDGTLDLYLAWHDSLSWAIEENRVWPPPPLQPAQR